nr:integrase, catalytic region, zinc finger, CCHC-type, peptidase aspartic, catalytic [Tanacetum cinerariifolium]
MKVWQPTGNMFKTVGHIWKPKGRTFTLVGNVFPLTRIATPTIVPAREPILIVNSTDKPVLTLVYSKKTKDANKKVPNKMEPNNSLGSSSSNVPSPIIACRLSNSSSGTWTPIMGYEVYQIGNVTISRVYYVEGLGHNIFSVGQFCDSDLEVAFRQHTCFIRNLDGVDLLTGSRGNNLYTLSLQDMMASSPIYLLSKASKTKSWLWHRRFMCNGQEYQKTHKPKSEDTNQEKLYRLHMDLCGPMRVESVNGKKYILFIIDDYSRFTWVKFLRSKDETPYLIIKFLKMIHVRLKVPVHLDQDAPSPSKTHTTTEIQSSVIPQDVGDDNLDMEVAHIGNDPLFSVPIPEVTSTQSSSTASPQLIVQTNHPMPHHNSK